MTWTALASVPPSNLSLLGIVRHMADVERAWFRIRFSGEPLPRLYDYEDAAFEHVDPDPSLDIHPHDRGVCPAQRPRRPAAAAHRRSDRFLTPAAQVIPVTTRRTRPRRR